MQVETASQFEARFNMPPDTVSNYFFVQALGRLLLGSNFLSVTNSFSTFYRL